MRNFKIKDNKKQFKLKTINPIKLEKKKNRKIIDKKRYFKKAKINKTKIKTKSK